MGNPFIFVVTGLLFLHCFRCAGINKNTRNVADEILVEACVNNINRNNTKNCSAARNLAILIKVTFAFLHHRNMSRKRAAEERPFKENKWRTAHSIEEAGLMRCCVVFVFFAADDLNCNFMRMKWKAAAATTAGFFYSAVPLHASKSE